MISIKVREPYRSPSGLSERWCSELIGNLGGHNRHDAVRAPPGVRNPGADRELLLDSELLAPVTGVAEYCAYAWSAEAAYNVDE